MDALTPGIPLYAIQQNILRSATSVALFCVSLCKHSNLGKRAKDTISYRRSVSAVASLKNLGTTNLLSY